MTLYLVTMQAHKHDRQGQVQDVETVEVDFSCNWDLGKIGFEEIAKACAAMHTCEHGWQPAPGGGTMPKVKFIGVTSRRLEDVEISDAIAPA